MVREWSAEPTTARAAKLRTDTLAFCRVSDGSPAETDMRRLLDGGMSLDALYPKDLVADVAFVRCLQMRLGSGEVVELDRASRRWTRTSRESSVRGGTHAPPTGSAGAYPRTPLPED